MSHHDYHSPALNASDDDGSDAEDLPLEELDPVSAASDAPASASKSNISNGHVPLQDLRNGDSRGLAKDARYNFRRGRLRKNASEEDLQQLLGRNQDVGGAGADPKDSQDDRNVDPDLAHIALPRRKGFFGLFRSSPKIEIEEEYNPAHDRHVHLSHPGRYPSNAVSNAKYNPWSFLPRTLYNEFSFFFNLYFLLVALSQLIRQLRIGFLSTYFAPLVFVLSITLGKEAYDDITRRRRDAELNSEGFTVLALAEGAKRAVEKSKAKHGKRNHSRRHGSHSRLAQVDEEEADLEGGEPNREPAVPELLKQSKDLKVGDVLKLGKDQRVPADAVILKSQSSDPAAQDDQSEGEAFVRTDQLDGETDWKLRVAPALSQPMSLSDFANLQVTAGKPNKNVNNFIGALSLLQDDASEEQGRDAKSDESKSVALSVDNTAWANTVLASNATVYAAIVYTGPQTRQALSTSASRSKVGTLEYEINNLTKILCGLTLLLSFILVALEGFQSPDGHKWYIAVTRFLILFSTIIPISLRVNLDLGKSVYSYFIHRDGDIPGTVVRTSTIPEDLGRIEYLLSDKTGTLTQNDMQLRKIHIGTVSYANEAMAEVSSHVRQAFGSVSTPTMENAAAKASATRSRREIGSRVRDLVLALAICHNVTPTTSEENGESRTSYQASSPDEIAIVQWTESVGLRLAHRDRHSMVLESMHTQEVVARIQILNLFPFTSEGKRMGIIVRIMRVDKSDPTISPVNPSQEPIWFFQKGADTVMSPIVASNDWLDEETANMAREGLRTLVVGRKQLTQAQYTSFATSYRQASLSLQNRDAGMAQTVRQHLEQSLDLLGVTGVEDKLQQDVKPSLELLRNAGIKIWMLTGDKVETARCVAVSSKLVSRGQYIHTVTRKTNPSAALDSLNLLHTSTNAALLIDGPTLSTLLSHYPTQFIRAALPLPALIATRCSPTQKADLARLLRNQTPRAARTAAIGDGGNDVSMIQTADVGLGIQGKEGRQASLAADFSVNEFRAVTKLLLWHGRNSYKRSAKLAQFVMHRGLVISACQTVFSIASKFEPRALYKDWLLVGYATVYTMAPVFSLVLDTDIVPRLAHLYPELYAEMASEKSLSYRTFFVWVGISLYQGVAIQLLSQTLGGTTLPEESGGGPAPRMVSLSFTSLIVNEMAMVCLAITTFHPIMVLCILGTFLVYLASIPLLGRYFDLGWMWSWGFAWRLAVVSGVAVVPVAVGRGVRAWVRPPSWVKVRRGM